MKRILACLIAVMLCVGCVSACAEGDAWICDRYRNGDESNFELYVHRGEIVRIRLNH